MSGRKAVLVIPFHDPEVLVLPHLQAVTPHLKRIYARVFIGLTHPTREAHPQKIARLQADPFFTPVDFDAGARVGDQFKTLFERAARAYPPEQPLHLAFPDRVAFALQNGHAAAFIQDVQSLDGRAAPFIFERSQAAWQTHPQNYRDSEQFLTRVGEYLLGKRLDFAWCYLVVSAGQLRKILPDVHNHDLSMMAEMVLLLKDEIRSKEVDWLGWEDPFIVGQDAAALKAARENNAGEIQKRLGYVLPMLEVLRNYRDE